MASVWSYVLGSVLVALVVGQFGWAARTLLKHAQILATITEQLKQLPDIEGKVDDLSNHVTDVRLEQARVKAELAILGRKA